MKPKSIIINLITIFCLVSSILAQPPQGINYQGVARDAQGHPLLSRAISIQLSVLDGSATGAVVYAETHNITTNSTGLFNMTIGTGTVVSGNFSVIPWGQGEKWLQTEMDTSGGSNFQLIGTTQFLSVPYALHSGNGLPTGNNTGDMLYWNGVSWVSIGTGSYGQHLINCNGVPTWGGCPPIVTTTTVTSIGGSTAISGGNILNDGGVLVTVRGICWSTAPNPTLSNSITTDGSGIGSYSSSLSGLILNTTYFVRAYATNSSGTSYGNEVTFTTPGTLSIGQNYQGGIIFYIDGSGYHGLIASPSDIPALTVWGCNGTLIGGTSTAFGNGMANTISIVNGCAQTGAARSCFELIANGYSDWYLPSRDELSLMRNNIGQGASGANNNLGGFQPGSYWSSSEVNNIVAWYQVFGVGGITTDYKYYNWWVRPIRTF